jgi:hypothetical protein
MSFPQLYLIIFFNNIIFNNCIHMIVDTLIYKIICFGNFNKSFFNIISEQITHSTNYGIKY